MRKIFFNLFLGSAGVCSVEKAKIEALQVGLPEVHQLNCQHIFVEGDSLCAIRWSLDLYKAPSVLGDAMEFIYLSKDIVISYAHAKEGKSRWWVSCQGGCRSSTI